MNKNIKKYLCNEGDAEFLIEAADIEKAKRKAKRMNMVVKAVWFERPSEINLNSERKA